MSDQDLNKKYPKLFNQVVLNPMLEFDWNEWLTDKKKVQRHVK